MIKKASDTSEGILSFIKGQMLLNQEKYPEAKEQLIKASSLLSTNSPFIHLKLAELQLKSGNLNLALEESKKAYIDAPEDVNVLLLYAGVLDALDNMSEAQSIYKKVIEKTPERLDAYILLSGLYTKKERYNEAIDVLNKFLKINADEAIVHYFLARNYEFNRQS